MPHNPYRRPDHRSLQAKEQGYPARSVFKLEEIDRRVRLFRAGHHVLDLGAAPGSWSMYATKRIGPTGRLLAVDLQPLSIAIGRGVAFVQGDVLSLESEILARYAPYDVVLSDMAPSTTGAPEADHARSMEVFLHAVDVATHLGARGSSFVGKLFMGEGFEFARTRLRERFNDVRTMRPATTRKRSVEIFLVGLKLRPA